MGSILVQIWVGSLSFILFINGFSVAVKAAIENKNRIS